MMMNINSLNAATESSQDQFTSLMINQFISKRLKDNLLQQFNSYHMQRPQQLTLQSQTGDNKFWKEYLREILVEQNEIKKIQIANLDLVGGDFTATGRSWGNTDFNDVLAQICESHINPNLGFFHLSCTRIFLNSFHRLTTFLSVNCRFLTNLTLVWTCLGDESISFIVGAQWRYIATFVLVANNITSKGVKQLRKCEWKFIKIVDFMDNPLKNTGVEQLIRVNWKGLTQLCMRNVELTDDGVKILQRAQWPKLIQLNLMDNKFTHEAVPHILRSNWKKPIFITFNQPPSWEPNNGNRQYLERKTNKDFISFGRDDWEDQGNQ